MARNSDTAFFGHPSGLLTLFFTEMWERFSYYGMRALLILFMVAPVATGGLGFPVDQAGAVYGSYTAMVYMMTIGGGWLADNLLGPRRTVFWGGVLIMSGHISLAIPALPTFYLGLVLVVLGTGLLKGNVSVLVGRLYREGDTRRDAGFSLYYTGINLGAFLGPLVCGGLAQWEGFRVLLGGWGISPAAAWHFGFGAAAVGMFFGLVQYLAGARLLPAEGSGSAGAQPAAEAARKRRLAGRVLAGIAVVAALGFGLWRTETVTITALGLAAVLDWVILAATVGLFGWLFLGGQWSRGERARLVAILVLFLGASVFWAAFEQGGSTLNLFAERNTANTVFGIGYPASWLQSVNSLFIITLAPVASLIWLRLGPRDPSSPAKFSIGLFLLSGSFAVMVGASLASAGGALVTPMWLVACYFLQTAGELCLSPVGLSAMTRLAPARVAGVMMGAWFLASAIGNKIAGRVGGLYESVTLPAIFGGSALAVLAFAAVMGLLVGPIRRMLARPS